jgi:ribosomal protein S12
MGTLVAEDVVSVTESSVLALDDSVESEGVPDVEFVVTADLPSSAYPKVMSMAITAGARVESFIVRIAASVRSSRIVEGVGNIAVHTTGIAEGS